MTLLTDALRSDHYKGKQAHSRLNIDNLGFCCLGVACEVAMSHGLTLHKYRLASTNYDDIDENINFDEYASLSDNVQVYDGCVYFLPSRVQEWFGFGDNQGTFLNATRPVRVVEYNAQQMSNLAQLNDTGASFVEIADIIDELWINPLKEIA